MKPQNNMNKNNNNKVKKLYPDSHVELKEFIAKNYDTVINIGTLGIYKSFIKKAVRHMNIQPGDHILDLGCGTGRNARLMCRYLNEKGHITGLDISEHMEKQFHYKFKRDKRAEYIKQRIDLQFNLQRTYDKVFISFVIHGFPHEIRSIVIQNAYDHIKPGGKFFILDFAEFDMDKMPGLHRFIFKTIECKYAFDFIKRNWKEILNSYGFEHITENLYLKKYIRLLSAQKNG
ncbi:MAG: class I SAM-dependent methyltransferase [Bacteroidales bacterium]|nr:class I SAM-dependent methyltransferase [Bacteroidales bacterium]